MNAVIIYDNATDNEEIRYGWGFSCLVDQRILFDTGEQADSLFHNMKQLHVDIDQIEAVVISHDHWDHTGGLWALLNKRNRLPIYACPGFSAEFKQKVRQCKGTLIEAETYKDIDEGVAITGEIPGEYNGAFMPEQALMLKSGKGITVITGCSHPGIVTMIQTVKRFYSDTQIPLVFGGFHLMNTKPAAIRRIAASMREIGVEKVGPTHCSGHEAQMIFKEIYGDDFIAIKAGHALEI
ncbi:MBL fold metallo-hydrolase [candidate division KSB1 bacterium]|nr:MBL fold metallo-hydrolase [candidate division KSB1 bacterium]